MLYPKNKDNFLSEELYQNPSSEYRGTPFWAWNCALDQKEILGQIDLFKTMGFGGFHMHVRTGMDIPYLSAEHMNLVSACVDKAKRENLLAWLYDEDRWPSGAAGGLVTKEEKYRQRYLLFTPKPYTGEKLAAETDASARAKRTENGVLLNVYAIKLDEEGKLLSYRTLGKEDMAAIGEEKWYAYLETAAPSPWFNNQTYADTLDDETMARFVDITYNTYNKKRSVSREFGKTVPAMFTDEPQFTMKGTLSHGTAKEDITLPWTRTLEETFTATYSEDLLACVPELIWEFADSHMSTVRYHYHDHIAERFAHAFADQCGKWCDKHGIMLTGHMMEEPTLHSQTSALGEAMRSYRSFTLPGIDMLCGFREYNTAKQAQSAVHQYDREGMASELYGVTGWDFDFRGHKIHGDWQAALGVTVRVPHLAWVSMKGDAKRDYPASIFYQSSYHDEYPYIENHFARLNTALTRGKPVVRVGVVHPIESYWLHWGPSNHTEDYREQLDENFKNITEWLLFGGIDFDFIAESLLPSLCKKGGNPLNVGAMAYDAIIVPGCETLRSDTLKRLEAFQKEGGNLIFVGDMPKYENAVPSKRGEKLYQKAKKVTFNKKPLLDALEGERMLSLMHISGKSADHLLHQLRRDGEGLWLFLANGKEPYNKDIATKCDLEITVKGKFYPTLYQTLTGDISSIPFRHKGDNTILSCSLYDYDSMLVYLAEKEEQAISLQNAGKTANANETVKTVKPVETATATETTKVILPKTVAYTLSEPNVLLLDKAEFALGDEPLSPETDLLLADDILRERLSYPSRSISVAQPWAIPSETPAHTVHLVFNILSKTAIAKPLLALEDAELAEIKYL